ncbi:hypothetical protein MICRO116_900008 [Micrococcus sp. 116]|nr:hypothetical protein MICRO116_900008 [Micrococcus sp. 116]
MAVSGLSDANVTPLTLGQRRGRAQAGVAVGSGTLGRVRPRG